MDKIKKTINKNDKLRIDLSEQAKLVVLKIDSLKKDAGMYIKELFNPETPRERCVEIHLLLSEKDKEISYESLELQKINYDLMNVFNQHNSLSRKLKLFEETQNSFSTSNNCSGYSDYYVSPKEIFGEN